MPRQTARRRQLYADLGSLGRETGTVGLLVHEAISTRFGLGPTDLKALDYAGREETLTPSRLAQLTGLSTSAITAALDRLERGDFIERKRDPDDRRKVIIALTGRRDEELAAAFTPLSNAFDALLDDYNEDELEFLMEHNRRVLATFRILLEDLAKEKP